MRRMLALIGLFLLLTAQARPGVSFASVFGSGMVLQRGRAVPVWGRAIGGARIEVSCAGQTKSTRADEDGNWRVDLDAMPAGGPHVLTASGDGTARCGDVLVGDVWLCSGQSNMAWNVASSADAEKEMAAARFAEIRLLTVPYGPADGPRSGFSASWKRCSPRAVRTFSAVAYVFGRELHRKLDVPIGLIATSAGGTPAEAWTDREALRREPRLQALLARWGERVRRGDEEPGGNDAVRSPKRPGTLWDGMVAPLVPYAVRGVIWYQGEANTGRADQYRTIFPTLITDWRAQWGQGDFPFLFVQLANFGPPVETPTESRWAELREAQRLTLSAVPQTGMAVTIDIGDAGELHPRNKQDVGRRLAAWALATVYGRDVVASGPLFREAKPSGKGLVLQFDHAAGLAARGGGALEGFAVAGPDKAWTWAGARIEGETVVVEHPQGSKALHVRYAWADNPRCNLVNGAGLPASPFRTDVFPLTTVGRD